MSRIVAIVSVDWEPDHGPWKVKGADLDYGGILKATPVLCEVLDELQIPCTWFIETSVDPKRNLPACFPEIVRSLAGRQRDELGMHVHWSRPGADETLCYETEDRGWVNEQLEHGIRQLDTVGVRPLAFRSGALLLVRSLPQLLSKSGFLVDSSTLWGRANRLNPDRKHVQRKSLMARCRTVLSRVFSAVPEPYFSDELSVEERGTSNIVEFPITYSLFESQSSSQSALCRYLRFKASFTAQTCYWMLFFHIDELTSIASGPDRQATPDLAMLRYFRTHLAALQREGVQFSTCAAARDRWLQEGSRRSPVQPFSPNAA